MPELIMPSDRLVVRQCRRRAPDGGAGPGTQLVLYRRARRRRPQDDAVVLGRLEGDAVDVGVAAAGVHPGPVVPGSGQRDSERAGTGRSTQYQRAGERLHADLGDVVPVVGVRLYGPALEHLGRPPPLAGVDAGGDQRGAPLPGDRAVVPDGGPERPRPRVHEPQSVMVAVNDAANAQWRFGHEYEP